MDIVHEIAAGRTRLNLRGDCTIYHGAELRVALLQALAGTSGLEIDLSGITEFDSAALQVLMAAKQSSRAAGQALGLINHSQAVLDLIELYDLASWLGDPLILPAASAASA